MNISNLQVKHISYLKSYHRWFRILTRLYRRTYVKHLIQRNQTRYTSTRLFNGDKFNVILPDNVSKATYVSGHFERHDTEAFIKLTNKGDCVIDIGAHIGYYSLIASSLVGSEGKVIAFEPTPSTFSLLQENLKNKKNTSTENKAVYKEEKSLTFNDFGLKHLVFNSFRAARLEGQKLIAKKIRVQTIILDNYVKNNNIKPNFIKIDAESAEMDILQGSIETIKRYSPTFFIEIGDFNHINGYTSLDIINFFLNQNYQVFDFIEGKFSSHQPLENHKYRSRNLFFSVLDLSNYN